MDPKQAEINKVMKEAQKAVQKSKEITTQVNADIEARNRQLGLKGDLTRRENEGK